MEITEVVGAAVLVLLGAVITAAINYIGTKQHDNLQMNLHRESLQQQANEARRDRIVQARSPLLLELREAASKTLATFTSFAAMTAITQANQQSDTPTPSNISEEQQKHLESWGEAQDYLFQLTPRSATHSSTH